jgi:hypothetical protein
MRSRRQRSGSHAARLLAVVSPAALTAVTASRSGEPASALVTV